MTGRFFRCLSFLHAVNAHDALDYCLHEARCISEEVQCEDDIDLRLSWYVAVGMALGLRDRQFIEILSDGTKRKL